jgi:hypothetical protein
LSKHDDDARKEGRSIAHAMMHEDEILGEARTQQRSGSEAEAKEDEDLGASGSRQGARLHLGGSWLTTHSDGSEEEEEEEDDDDDDDDYEYGDDFGESI